MSYKKELQELIDEHKFYLGYNFRKALTDIVASMPDNEPEVLKAEPNRLEIETRILCAFISKSGCTSNEVMQLIDYSRDIAAALIGEEGK